MSLMAAVTASGKRTCLHIATNAISLIQFITQPGTLDVDMQRAFVEEVQRVGGDSVYWVRREASFALGALAKVVPEDLVISTLVSILNLFLCS